MDIPFTGLLVGESYGDDDPTYSSIFTQGVSTVTMASTTAASAAVGSPAGLPVRPDQSVRSADRPDSSVATLEGLTRIVAVGAPGPYQPPESAVGEVGCSATSEVVGRLTSVESSVGRPTSGQFLQSTPVSDLPMELEDQGSGNGIVQDSPLAVAVSAEPEGQAEEIEILAEMSSMEPPHKMMRGVRKWKKVARSGQQAGSGFGTPQNQQAGAVTSGPPGEPPTSKEVACGAALDPSLSLPTFSSAAPASASWASTSPAPSSSFAFIPSTSSVTCAARASVSFTSSTASFTTSYDSSWPPRMVSSHFTTAATASTRVTDSSQAATSRISSSGISSIPISAIPSTRSSSDRLEAVLSGSSSGAFGAGVPGGLSSRVGPSGFTDADREFVRDLALLYLVVRGMCTRWGDTPDMAKFL